MITGDIVIVYLQCNHMHVLPRIELLTFKFNKWIIIKTLSFGFNKCWIPLNLTPVSAIYASTFLIDINESAEAFELRPATALIATDHDRSHSVRIRRIHGVIS